ncbi:MAG TPA: sigma-70 family RNA polymerase sigma factor [Nocardioides sp.]|nr:sigma-70 family RNA polymerase sigma factor [Nocardioides sp.]
MTTVARAAIRTVLREVSDDLLAYLERRVRSREDAADLLGETMLQAWRRIDAFPADDRARQRMWLFTIAANVLSNHHRSRRRGLALADRLRTQLGTSDPVPDTAEVNAVRDAVLRLRDAQRELVMLVHWDGFTILEAAEVLGVNPSTARSRYAAARAVLREALSENAPV